MKFTLSLAVGFLATTSQLVQAVPSAPVNCDPISKYSLEWFQKNFAKDPTKDQCLFYTFHLSSNAINTSKNSRLEAIWGFWKSDQYNPSTTNLQNKMRCIFANDNERTTYFENMSLAMAEKCKGTAYVMTNDINNIPRDGIYGRIEEPALKKNKDIDSIIAIDTLRTKKKTIYTRGGHKRSDEVEDIDPEDTVDTESDAESDVDSDSDADSTITTRDLPNNILNYYSVDDLAALGDKVHW